MLNEHIRKDTLIKLYFSRQQLEDYESDDRLVVCKGKISQIISDSEVEIVLDKKEEESLQKNVCYVMYLFLPQDVLMCNCYYKTIYTEEEKQIVTLELVSPFERVQRRMHQRVSCHSKILYQQISKEEATKFLKKSDLFTVLEEQTDPSKNSLVDISGGGIRFTSKNPIPVDAYLFAKFEITSEKRVVEMKIIGQVIYSMPLRNEQDCYDIRIKYVGLTEEERKQIIHFVFQLERDSINTRWQRGGGFA